MPKRFLTFDLGTSTLDPAIAEAIASGNQPLDDDIQQVWVSIF